MTDQSDPSLVKLLDRIQSVSQNMPQGSAQSQQSYEVFIDQLINERKFPDLTPEVRVELKKDLVNRLDSFIAAKVIALLSDEDVLKFEQLLKENRSSEEIQKFTVDHIADFTTFLTNALLEFRGVYLGLIQVPVSVNVDLVHAKDGQGQSVTSANSPRPRAMPPAPVATKDLSEKKTVN